MSLLRTSMVVSFLSLFSSLVSFANQLVIAHFFGATKWMDAYLVAASLPVLISGTIGAAISYSMVPALITHRSMKTKNDGGFPAAMAVSMAIIGLVTTVIGIAFSKMLVMHLAVGLDSRTANEAVFMAKISWVTAGIAILQAFMAAIHNVDRRFYVPVLAGSLPYLGMIIAGILLSRNLGPASIAWGMLAGTLASCFFLMHGTAKYINSPIITAADLRAALNFLKSAPHILLAMACFTVYQAVDAYWAPRLGIGNMSYLGYCQRLIVAIGTLVIAGPSVVLVPLLAEAHAEGRNDDFLSYLARALRMVIAIAMPIALLVSLLSVPIVELLFQRGAFSASATKGVSEILPFMLSGMVAMLCVVMIFRALYARGQFGASAFLGLVSISLYFAQSGLFSSYLMLRGIAIAYTSTWWIMLLISVIVAWNACLNYLSLKNIAFFVAKITIALIVMGIAIHITSIFCIQSLASIGKFNLAVNTLLTASLGIAIYLFIAIKLLRISEITLLWDKMLNPLKAIQS